MRPTILRLALACTLLGAAGAGGQMVVVPNGLELTAGNGGNSFPFQLLRAARTGRRAAV